MKHVLVRSVLVSGLFMLAACSLFGETEVKPAEQINGFWEAVSGDLQFSGAPGGIYYYNWYRLEASSSSDQVAVTWDDGRTCSTTLGTRQGRQIHLTVGGVETIFTVTSATEATVRFETAGKGYAKQLVRQRERTSVFCL